MNKSLLIAIAVLIGLSVAVAMTRRSHESQTTVEKPVATLPKVKKEEITRVELTKPGQPTIVLEKQSDNWRMKAPVEAEASKTSSQAVADKIAELDVASVAGTRKENHKKLEVDAEHAIHVVAKGGGDKVLADLYIGAAKSGGTMVRAEGHDEVYAARGSIRYVFEREVKDYRDRDVTDIPNAELTNVEVSSAKGTFKFAREGENPWAQAKGEKAIAKFDPEKVTSLLNTAAHLYATDFAEPNADDATTGLASPQSKVTLTKKDGSKVELALGKQHKDGQDYFVRSSANPTVIYRISNFNAERLMPDAKFFEKDEQKPVAQPSGGGAPVAGGGELPPEILKQLQQYKPGGGAHP